MSLPMSTKIDKVLTIHNGIDAAQNMSKPLSILSISIYLTLKVNSMHNIMYTKLCEN